MFFLPSFLYICMILSQREFLLARNCQIQRQLASVWRGKCFHFGKGTKIGYPYTLATYTNFSLCQAKRRNALAVFTFRENCAQETYLNFPQDHILIAQELDERVVVECGEHLGRWFLSSNENKSWLVRGRRRLCFVHKLLRLLGFF